MLRIEEYETSDHWPVWVASSQGIKDTGDVWVHVNTNQFISLLFSLLVVGHSILKTYEKKITSKIVADCNYQVNRTWRHTIIVPFIQVLHPSINVFAVNFEARKMKDGHLLCCTSPAGCYLDPMNCGKEIKHICHGDRNDNFWIYKKAWKIKS